MIQNIYDLSVTYIKGFKENYMNKIIELIEHELPNSENKVEPVYLEIVFRL